MSPEDNVVDQLLSTTRAMSRYLESEELKTMMETAAVLVSVYYKKLIEEGIPKEVASEITAAYSTNMLPKTS